MSASPQREGDGDPEVAPPGDDTNDSEPKPLPEGESEGMQDPDALYAIEVKEQDRWLPIANVARIMKTALPDNAKIAKEAKECMQECVSEFISFITSEASEKCQQEKRKTVNGEDILFAMTSLGFENYSEALKSYLARYREANVSKSDQNRPSSSYDVSGTGPDLIAPAAAGELEEHLSTAPTGPIVEANEPALAVPTVVDPVPTAVAPVLETAPDPGVIPQEPANFRVDEFHGEPQTELNTETVAANFATAPADPIQTTNGETIKLPEYNAPDPVGQDLTEPQPEGNGDFRYDETAGPSF